MGLFLLKFGKACILLRAFQDGLNFLNEAEDILNIALGPKHMLIKETLIQYRDLANEDINILMNRRIAAQKEKEEKERRKREELDQLNNLLATRKNAKPIWETDRKLFESEKAWRQMLSS